MSNKPLWLERLTPSKRAAILAKAHAIILDDVLAGDIEVRVAANIVWMLKSKYEQEAKKD